MACFVPEVSSLYDISGLYTDGFSTCNILILFNKAIGSVELAHIDASIALRIEQVQEQSSLDDATEIVLISREDKGKKIRDTLVDYLKAKYPAKTVTVKMADMSESGVQASSVKKDGTFQLVIEKFSPSSAPNNILHHPDEQKFLAVQKIEQIIGRRAKITSRTSLVRRLCIFDGICWEHMESLDFKIDESHSITQQEMSRFSESDSCDVVVKKLAEILQLTEKEGAAPSFQEDLESFLMEVAGYFENYLNNYDYDLLLRRSNESILSTSDRSTPDKAHVANEFLVSNYLTRELYKKFEQTKEEKIGAAKAANKYAIEAYQNKQYVAAGHLFFSILKTLTYYCVKSDPLLAVAYYNLGRTFFREDNYRQSHFFLKTAALLRSQKYFSSQKGNAAELKKVESALQECESKLAEKNSVSPPTPNL